MKVKTLKPHYNPHGAAFEKKEGDEYALPDREAAGLIIAGLVEEAATPAKRKAGKGEAVQD
jgi:hypothetical protein